MKILVDENIPLARELFGSLGDIRLVSGRDVDESYPRLGEFDILAIRSVTAITPAMVDHAVNVRIIGTATIGTDHIDVDYIRQANRHRNNPIAVISAPGSNAESVADCVWFALAHLTRDGNEPLGGRSLGIVGHGNCGSRVARRAQGFGMKVLRCDPPLAERDPTFRSDTFEDTIGADFVTLHVPLTRERQSDYPTYHMIGAEQTARMKPGAYLLNTSRGAVVDSPALIGALKEGGIAGAVLDVYEGEPEPPAELISLPVLATPHIAGYAVEAKRRGAVVVYEQMCRTLGVEPQNTRALLMRGFEPEVGMAVEFDASGSTVVAADAALRSLLRQVHDIGAVSRELKGTLTCARRGELFDRMRRDYEGDYGRHELSVYRVGFDASVPSDLRNRIGRRLHAFGIQVTDERPNYVLAAR